MSAARWFGLAAALACAPFPVPASAQDGGGVIKGLCDGFVTIEQCLDHVAYEWEPWKREDLSKYATATAMDRGGGGRGGPGRAVVRERQVEYGGRSFNAWHFLCIGVPITVCWEDIEVVCDGGAFAPGRGTEGVLAACRIRGDPSRAL